MIFNPSILRGVYRDTITILFNTTLYRKTVDKGIITELYYFYIKS